METVLNMYHRVHYPYFDFSLTKKSGHIKIIAVNISLNRLYLSCIPDMSAV